MGEQLIPATKLQNEKYMTGVRNCFTLNISMPGTLENENPNRFLKGNFYYKRKNNNSFFKKVIFIDK